MPDAPISSTVPTVQKDMVVQDILSLCPQASDIMAEYGLHCFSCSIGGVETLQQGCEMHGFDEDTIDALVEDLNQAIAEIPPRPALVTVTKEAAEAVISIAKQEGYEGNGLCVVADASGGFCMEFQSKPGNDDHVFTCEEQSDVRVFVPSLTLWRIGGAVIDFRDGRFKLDLPEDEQCNASCNSESCGCA